MLVATLVGVCGVLVGVAVLVGAYDLWVWSTDRAQTECLWLGLLAACQALVLGTGAVVLLRPTSWLYTLAIDVRATLFGVYAILATVVIAQLIPGLAIRIPVLVTTGVLVVRTVLLLATDLIVRHPLQKNHWPVYGTLSKTGLVYAVAVFWVTTLLVIRAHGPARTLVLAAVGASILIAVGSLAARSGEVFEALVTFQVVPSASVILVLGVVRIGAGARERDHLAAREAVVADLGQLSVAHGDLELVRREAQDALAQTEQLTIDIRVLPDPESDVTDAVVVRGRQVTVAASGPRDLDAGTRSFISAVLQVVAATADRAALVADVAYSATHDDVTGLPNRVLVLDRIGAQLADPERGRTALVLCGLTRYDEHLAVAGVDGADRLARRVAATLASPLAGPDTLGRLAATIFAVVCRLDEDDLAGALARRVQDLSLRLRAGIGTTTPVGPALGAAVAGPGASASDLVRDATAALRRSAAGSGAPEVFDAELGARLRERAELEQGLVGAAERDEIVVYYQPIVDAGTRKITAYEALARWRRGTTLVPPDTWVSVAESLGLLDGIADRVLRIALRDQPLLGTKVTVNVSPQQLASDTFVERTLELIDAAEPGVVLLEITETAVMADLERARRTLTRFREHGVLISLDDFGTSYSSLGALATLPIDGIKIDRVFVEGLTGAKGPDMVAAIVGLARTLDKVTVIEGVETEEQFATLAAIGVDRVQGYLIGRPGPLEDFVVP